MRALLLPFTGEGVARLGERRMRDGSAWHQCPSALRLREGRYVAPRRIREKGTGGRPTRGFSRILAAPQENRIADIGKIGGASPFAC